MEKLDMLLVLSYLGEGGDIIIVVIQITGVQCRSSVSEVF